MNTKKITAIFVISFIAIAAVYDGWAWSQGGTEATISWLVFEAGHKYPLTAVAVGILIGHWYWQMKAMKKLRMDFEDHKKKE